MQYVDDAARYEQQLLRLPQSALSTLKVLHALVVLVQSLHIGIQVMLLLEGSSDTVFWQVLGIA